jgi:uncharacterized protein YukE
MQQGMDETYFLMRNFHQSLSLFNDSLRASVANLEAEHDKVSPHWQDQWRRDYDAIWNPFEETMKRYIDIEGPSYVEFLDIKSKALWRYLNGG